MSRGRKPSTGNCATREELERSVREDYHADHGRRHSIRQVAILNGISVALVHRILDQPSKPTTKSTQGPEA